ncbi:hypothetical protein EV178_003399 [Coemansia sp. RSA 1646]|nr:hypothetical protein EV178_003399 [Coemansia sp. RSA 1646]KAJ2093504.1 hypothetical protein IW138_000355 [Coemansia sp. RSA 986]KAJ2214321.1 hypothetical protein EV179_003101 [Coemansia sp. RSA 487]
MSLATNAELDALWVGTPFKPMFDPRMHPALSLAFATVGLVYAGKFIVTRKDFQKEVLFAAVSSGTLGLAAVLGAQALGLYL